MGRRARCAFTGATFMMAGYLSPAHALTLQQQMDQCSNKNSALSPDHVISACTEAIKSGSWRGKDLAWAYEQRGNAYLDNEDPDNAIADYNEAIRLNPKDTFAYSDRGNAYRIKHDYDHAITDYNEAIRLDAKYAGGYNGRGAVYDDKGDYDHAIADYNEAIRLDAKYAPAYNNRGNAYNSKGDLDHAIADYNEAIRLDAKNAPAYNNRGNAYKKKGDLDHAITDYNEAIRLDAKYAGTYNDRGNAYNSKGDLDHAIADYNEAIRLDSKYARARFNRGDAYNTKGDHDQAIADYGEAIRLDSKYSDAYFARGRLYVYEPGALPKALADLNQANALDPKNAYSALWLDIVDKRSTLPSRLAEAIMQIDMTKWPAPIIRLYLGQLTPEAVLVSAENPDAETRKGQVCEANFYTGELDLLQGKKDDANRLFQVAAANCPNDFMEYDGANAELRTVSAQP
jgi:tetratricopeptide (TPR) repeat protein